MLIDQRSACGAVAHLAHQLPETGASRRRDVIAGMPQVVEMEINQSGRLGGRAPYAAEVEASQWAILRPDEHEAVVIGGGELLRVRLDLWQEEGRQRHNPLASL